MRKENLRNKKDEKGVRKEGIEGWRKQKLMERDDARKISEDLSCFIFDFQVALLN